jgi:hypothetical protein
MIALCLYKCNYIYTQYLSLGNDLAHCFGGTGHGPDYSGEDLTVEGIKWQEPT